MKIKKIKEYQKQIEEKNERIKDLSDKYLNSLSERTADEKQIMKQIIENAELKREVDRLVKKEALVSDLLGRLNNLEKEHSSFITFMLPDGTLGFRPNYDYLNRCKEAEIMSHRNNASVFQFDELEGSK